MVNSQMVKQYTMDDLLDIMVQLRAPDGCPWDRVQTHQSIRQNMLEEAYEAADAIDRMDMENLKEELGDVLLQVVFHATWPRRPVILPLLTWWTAYVKSWCSVIPTSLEPWRRQTRRAP